MKIGHRPDHGFDEPLGLLSDCHRRIEHFLAVMIAIEARTSGGALTPGYRTELEGALTYFATAAPRHTADEEESLFPRLRESSDPRATDALEQVARLERDHDEADAHHRAVDELGRRWLTDGSLGGDDTRQLREHLIALQAIYGEHIRVEDCEVFPTAAAVLSSEQVAQVGREMALRRSMTHRLVSVIFVLMCVAGAASAQTAASLAPRDWDAGLRLADLRDKNPDPKIVEIDMTARMADVEVEPGRKVHAWTYDGTIPGPLIRAHVGDRVIVHFTNDLPQPTTIHWHGVRVPIEMDGVPGISQPEIQRGETFTYDFVVRDAGLYWYHPHVMSAAEVGFGLYGVLLVEDPADGVNVADELTLALSDIGFDAKGVLDSPDTGGPAGMVFGREGAYVLANGKVMPTLRVRSGAPQRWRIVNTAKSRFFLLDLDGQPFYVIGSDGGLQERPDTVDTLLLTPGERADVIVTPKGPRNGTLVLRAMLYNRGYGSVEYRNTEDVLTIAFTDQPTLPAPKLPAMHRDIAVPDMADATPVNIVLSLPPSGADGKSEWDVNGVPFWKAKPYLASIGETQIWTVKNESKFAHPFHLHGFFFLPLDEKLQPIRPMAWKDTLNVPMEGTVRFLVVFDERPGMWMFHCHILDHADGGLMGHVQVGSPSTTDHMHPK